MSRAITSLTKKDPTQEVIGTMKESYLGPKPDYTCRTELLEKWHNMEIDPKALIEVFMEIYPVMVEQLTLQLTRLSNILP